MNLFDNASFYKMFNLFTLSSKISTDLSRLYINYVDFGAEDTIERINAANN